MAGSLGELKIELNADIARLDAGFKNASQIADKEMAKVIKAIQQTDKTTAQTQAALEKMMRSLSTSPSDNAFRKVRADAKAAEGAMHEFSFKTAGAKRELLVLAHEMSQGNYSKFAGSMMVLGERTGAAALLFNPLTLGILAAGAGLAAMGYQVYKGHEDWVALGNSIKSTGDYTGYTQHQLDQMSVYFARSSAEIQSGREALIALIATGRFTGDQLKQVGRVAIDMASDTGASIEDVAKELAKLPDGARKWAEEYQKTHHIFTAANIELIDSLDRQGKQAAATTAALDAMNEGHKRVADTMRRDKGTWDQFWDDWSDGLARIKNGIRDIGKPDSNFDELNKAIESREGLLSALKTNQDRLNGSGGKDMHLKDQVADISAAIAVNLTLIASLRSVGDAQRARAKVNADIAKGGDQKIVTEKYLDSGTKNDKQKYLDKINVENKSYQETIANLDKNSRDYEAVLRHHKENIAEIEAEYAKKTKPKEYQDSAATKFLQSLRDQDAELKNQLQSTQGLSSAKKEQVDFDQKMLDFKGKKLTTEQKSLVSNEAAIRAQLAINVADADQLRMKNEIVKLGERSAQISQQMESNKSTRDDGYQRQLDAVGMGKAAQSQITSINAIEKEYQRYQDQLTKATPADLLGSDQFKAQQAAIKAGMESSIGDYKTYFTDIKSKQLDWRNGATQAFEDYRDSATNMSSQIESALTGAFKASEDALAKFMLTGKLSFSGFAQSIMASMAQIQAKSIMNSLMGGSAGGGGMLGSLLNSAITGMGNGWGIGNTAGVMAGASAAPYSDVAGEIFSLAGAFAGGGSANAGSSYLVGEKGPEIFTPTGSGVVIPNSSMNGGSGGGSVHYNPVIQIDSRTDQAQVHQLVSSAVQQGNANLIDQLQRAGRL